MTTPGDGAPGGHPGQDQRGLPVDQPDRAAHRRIPRLAGLDPGGVRRGAELAPSNAPIVPPTGKPGEPPDRRSWKRQLKEKDEYLHTIIDELEATNQDLKSANEELQAPTKRCKAPTRSWRPPRKNCNRSMRNSPPSTPSCRTKNEELAGVNNDIFNLLASTEIATLFLDLDLHLRRLPRPSNRHLQLPAHRYRAADRSYCLAA